MSSIRDTWLQYLSGFSLLYHTPTQDKTNSNVWDEYENIQLATLSLICYMVSLKRTKINRFVDRLLVLQLSGLAVALPWRTEIVLWRQLTKNISTLVQLFSRTSRYISFTTRLPYSTRWVYHFSKVCVGVSVCGESNKIMKSVKHHVAFFRNQGFVAANEGRFSTLGEY